MLKWANGVGSRKSLQFKLHGNRRYCIAKARNLDTNGIQSFIQTDAAVNQAIAVAHW
jgi:S1-C subfamily serine protease